MSYKEEVFFFKPSTRRRPKHAFFSIISLHFSYLLHISLSLFISHMFLFSSPTCKHILIELNIDGFLFASVFFALPQTEKQNIIY